MSSPRKPRPPEPPSATLDLFTPRAAAQQERPPSPPPPRPTRPTPPASPPLDAHADWEPYFEDGEVPPDVQAYLLAPPPSAAATQQTAPAQKAPAAPRVYQVAELVRLAGRALEARFTSVWVEGEISNCRVQPQGHIYLTLKDQTSQLPAVMFRLEAQRLRFRVVDGLKVRARGRLSVYEPQGKFQLTIDALEPAGLGALQLAFEQLKRRLEAEGLFAAARKRRLPFVPRRIGVATSATGAAVQDIVRVASRRGPARILIAPCAVQGEAAPLEIVRAIKWLERQRHVDVIIVGRGGGSIEDLWAFNDERVARAIAECRVPVISAVGHEVDFTIADFVADQRAATPSQAAELAVPVHADLERRLADLRARLERAGRRPLGDARQTIDELRARALALLQRSIQAQRLRLAREVRVLDGLHPRARLERDRASLERMVARLQRPVTARLARGQAALVDLGRRLDAASQYAVGRRRLAFAAACGKLGALSPLRVLERGYSLVRDAAGRVITRSDDVQVGDRVTVELATGGLAAIVDERRPPRREGEDP